MRLIDSDIDKFIDIYKKVLGKDITRKEAIEYGHKAIDIIRICRFANKPNSLQGEN